MDKQDVKNLKKRYLVWLYKTTKEAFDKYERKFTQVDIDKDLLSEMENALLGAYLPHEKQNLEKFIEQYKEYISAKEKACLELKYQGKKTNPEFLFLDIKLNAVEKIIARELGKKELEKIKAIYEAEMTERILRSTQH
jgi:flagellar biosynthesis chaperone FliJ